MKEIDKYTIDGLKIDRIQIEEKYGYIQYKTFLCKMSIAQDMLGIQICYNGRFFGKSFASIEEGVKYLRKHKKKAITYFRKVFIQSFKYKFSFAHIKFIYWSIRHYFQPTYYL